MARPNMRAALALKPGPTASPRDVSSLLARATDDDLLYVAIALAKQKAVTTDEFLAAVGLNFELLKKRSQAARKRRPLPRIVPFPGGRGLSSETQITPLFQFGF
ncbi:MAG: hypothetical protein QME71_08630 [Dehalococcoidia bacterium]|nr:hypothetical protein [Dehalococcoidia bacterium]